MTLEPAPERYLTFNLREDRLQGMGVGTPLDLSLEAAGHGSRQGSARRADSATSPPGGRHAPWATTI